MPVLAYRPKLKSRLLGSQNAAQRPGLILSENQSTLCLVFGIGGPLVMIAGAVYLFALHQMGRLMLSEQAKNDIPGLETGAGFAMLCFGGIAGIAGGFFYVEGQKGKRWKAENDKSKTTSRRSSRAKTSLAPLETIAEDVEVGQFDAERRQRSSSRKSRSKSGSGRRSRRSSAAASETPSTTTTNAVSLSELHTFPFSSLETISSFQTEAEIPPDYSTLFPDALREVEEE